MTVTGAEVVAEARLWLGTPYRHQADVRGAGCDCIGLVAGVAEELGIAEAKKWRADPEFRGYGPTPLRDKLLAACDRYLDRLSGPAAAELGDVLLFRIVGQPMHFGIVSSLEPRCIIHGYSTARRVVENSLSGKWQRRLMAAYRYRGKV